MSSQIAKAYITELEQIKTEIQRNNKINKELRQREAVLEQEIKTFLVNNQHEGITYKGKMFTLKHENKVYQKPRKEREKSVIDLLEQLGINNPVNAYNEIVKVQRKSPVVNDKLKIKSLNKTGKTTQTY